MMSQLSKKSKMVNKQSLNKVNALKPQFVLIFNSVSIKTLNLDIFKTLSQHVEKSWPHFWLVMTVQKMMSQLSKKSLNRSINKVSTSLNKFNALKSSFVSIFNNILIETLDLDIFKTLSQRVEKSCSRSWLVSAVETPKLNFFSSWICIKTNCIPFNDCLKERRENGSPKKTFIRFFSKRILTYSYFNL